MKLQPMTLALLIGAAVLGSVIYFTEIHPSAQKADQADAGSQPLFDFAEADVQAFSVTTPLRTVSFKKTDDGSWQMVEPDPGLASEPTVAYLLNLLATGQSDRTLSVPASEWEVFGFHQPLADITVTVADGQTHTLKIGEYDFNRSSLYALRDAPDNAPQDLEELPVLLVSPDFENAVSRPLEDWKKSADESDNPTNSTDESPEPNTTESPTEANPDTPSLESTESAPEESPVE